MEDHPPGIRTDLEPLRQRFPRLGRMVKAHWQGRVVGADSWIPGPSDILIQAVVVLDADDLDTIAASYTWEPPKTGWDKRMSDQLRPFVPIDGDWQHNEQFEADVRTSIYIGAVYLDLRNGIVYLNVSTT